MKYLSLLLIITLTVACNREKWEIDFETSEKKINLNFECSHMVSGIICDTIKKKESYFFGELITTKKIDIYDADFKFIRSIDLKKFIEEKNNVEIRDVAFITRDSILLFAESVGTAYLINSQGELLKELDINASRKNYDYDLYTTIYHHFYNPANRSMIFAQAWSNRNLIPEEVAEQGTEIPYGYNQKRLIPKYVEVKNFVDTKPIETIDHLKGFNAKIFPKNALSFEFDYYYISKNRLFFSSWYSDKIFVYDLLKKRLTNEVVIKSEFTPIGTKPMIIDKSNQHRINENVNETGSFKGQINRIFYDDARDLLYVLVYHEEKNLHSKFYGVNRNWSLIVYKNLNKKVYEKKFSHGSHSIGFSMLSRSGLWIRKYDPNMSENELVFDCFSPVVND